MLKNFAKILFVFLRVSVYPSNSYQKYSILDILYIHEFRASPLRSENESA